MDELRHSRLSIASTVMGIMGFVVTLILVIAAAFLYGKGVDENSLAMILLGLFIFLDIIFLAVGAALGLAAVFNPYRKKTFSIIGILSNLCVMAALILLLIIGLKP